MKIVTNPGSNLPRQALEHYAIEVSPQQIVVDGTTHDTRATIPYATIDRWIRTSPEFPHVVGTTAQEFVAIFSVIGREDPEILTVLTSRKIIKSHAAAVAAVRALKAAAAFKDVDVGVVDSRMTDGATGLFAIAAGEARRANLGLARTQRLLELLAQRSTMAFVPSTLDNLVRGGRAGWARAQIANLFQLLPIIGFKDGELESLGRVRRSADVVEALIENALRTNARGKAVWVAVIHSDPSDERALNLLARVRATFDVRYALLRPLASSVYLHVGAAALGLVVVPVNDLPWELPTPPAFGP